MAEGARDRLSGLRSLVAVVASLLLAPAVAEGAHSYWNASRTSIYTRHDDGAVRLGGTVDGVTMVQFHAALGSTGMINFVRSRTDAGAPLHWRSSCVYITPDSEGTTDVAGDLELEILDKVLANWVDSTRDCGVLTFVREEPQAREVGYDGYNIVKYRHDTWCRPPESEGSPPECYSDAAAAITTLFFIDRPGEPDDGIILDADIEFNAVNFAIATGCETTCETAGTGILADLENTLTHEVGHLVGLDHTCWEGSPEDAPPDHTGEPVPQCFPETLVPAENREATMYNFQTQGETKKRTLEDDDIAGFCDIYPTGAQLGACARVDVDGDSGWCAAVPARERTTRGLGPLGMLAFGVVIAVSGLCSRLRRRDPL